jgi:membrane-associated phospholipid phosphatase
MSILWDTVSLSLIPLIITPIALYIRTKNPKFIPVLVSLVIIEIIISFSRQLPHFHPVMLRPAGAKDCNLFNSGGSYDGGIGMPSGHVMLTTTISLSLLFIYSGTNNLYTIFKNYPIEFTCTISYILLMAISRVKRNCHNIPQVIVGAILGYGLAYSLY